MRRLIIGLKPELTDEIEEQSVLSTYFVALVMQKAPIEQRQEMRDLMEYHLKDASLASWFKMAICGIFHGIDEDPEKSEAFVTKIGTFSFNRFDRSCRAAKENQVDYCLKIDQIDREMELNLILLKPMRRQRLRGESFSTAQDQAFQKLNAKDALLKQQRRALTENNIIQSFLLISEIVLILEDGEKKILDPSSLLTYSKMMLEDQITFIRTLTPVLLAFQSMMLNKEEADTLPLLNKAIASVLTLLGLEDACLIDDIQKTLFQRGYISWDGAASGALLGASGSDEVYISGAKL